MLIEWFKRCCARMPGIRELIQLGEALRGILWQLDSLRAIQAIRVMDFELREHPRYGDPLRLLRYQFQVCSQGGEDGIIREVFRRIGATDRYFVELGVGDGKENNTAFLLSQGWKGAWIDADEALLATLDKRPDLRDGRLKWLVSRVTRENVSAHLDRLDVPGEFDLLSIDIDQNTYYAWEGLRAYRPRVVVVEYNAVIPPDLDWKVPYDPGRTWDFTHNFGAGLKAYEDLGRALGYSLVGCEFTGNNAFFVRDDLVGDRFAAPFTSENHHEPARYAYVLRRGHAADILDGRGVEDTPSAGSRPPSAGHVEKAPFLASPHPPQPSSGSQWSQDHASLPR